MKRITLVSILSFAVILLSCNKGASIDPIFTKIERLIDTDIDEATSILHRLFSYVDSTPVNKACYYLFFTELSSKKNSLTIQQDSLIDQSIQVFKAQKIPTLHARAYLNKGRIWASMNLNKDALAHYFKALAILDKHPDNKLLAKIYDDIGKIYVDQDQLDDALQMFNKAFAHDSIRNDGQGMINSLVNMARTHLLMDNAQAYTCILHKAYSIVPQTADSLRQKSYLDHFASIYHLEMGHYNEALHYNTESINHHHPKDELYKKYLVKGQIYHQLNQHDSALYYIQQSLNSDYLFTKTAAQHQLYELYSTQGEYQKALEAICLYQQGADSLYFSLYDTETKGLIYKHNVEKAVMDVHATHKTTTVALIAFFSASILLSSLLYLVRDRKAKRQNRLKEKEIEKNKTEIVKKEKEVRSLQDKIKTFQVNVLASKQLEDTLIQHENTIKIKEDDLHLLMKRNINSQCSQFKKTPVYSKIFEISLQEKQKNSKVLNYAEQDELRKEVQKNFPWFIKELSQAFPSLSEDDLLFCCLSVLELSTYTISLCLSVGGTNTIKQRKHRLKLKMAKYPENLFLQNFIFPNKR